MTTMMVEMPDRVFDVGIAEGHAVTFSAGMAKDGLLPFCNIYSSFAQRAYDNIIHDVAIGGLHVIICLDRAGLVGEDGPTHHGAFDIAALRTVPNLIICSPMTEPELRNLMYTATLHAHPWVIRYPRGKGSTIDWRTEMQEVAIGTGRKLCSGSRLCVLSIGPLGVTVDNAIHNSGLSDVAHYDMRFVKPLDDSIMHEVAEANYEKIITIEDGSLKGGFGSCVAEWLESNRCTTPLQCLGLPDSFVEHGPVKELYRITGLDEDSIKKLISI